MDDWQRKLARELVAETPAGALPDGAATMEIGFGSARAAVTYALELARAYRLPATGSVAGDHVWLRLGDGRAKLTLNRREGQIECDVTLPAPAGDTAAAPQERHTLVRWDDEARALLDSEGARVDLGALARTAIDGLVADWRTRPLAEKKVSSAPPPDLEDTPTRG
jgi:hypothetical protein